MHGEVLCSQFATPLPCRRPLFAQPNNLCSADCKLPRNLEADTAVAASADELF